jgi:chitinase
MSLSHFRIVLTIALLLLFPTLPFASTPRQGLKQDSASVTINPPEATVHVGQTQTFEAVVRGTESTGIRWAVAERNGGRITEDGIYTAPRHVGLYHVVATSEENPAAKAVAKVTVVTEYDVPDSQKLR